MKNLNVITVLSLFLSQSLYAQSDAPKGSKLDKKVTQIIEDMKSAGTKEEPVSEATKEYIDSAINSQLNETIKNKNEKEAAVLVSENCKDWTNIKTQKTPVIHGVLYYKEGEKVFAIDGKKHQSFSYEKGKFLSLMIIDKAIVGFFDKTPMYRGINNEKIHSDLAGMLQALGLIAADAVTSWNVSFKKQNPVLIKNINDPKDELLKDYGFLGCVKEICFVTKNGKSFILTNKSEAFPKLKIMGAFSAASIQKLYNMCSIMEKNSFLTDNELAMRNFANMCGITVDPNYYNDLAKTITSGCSNLKSDLLPKIQNFQGSRDY